MFYSIVAIILINIYYPITGLPVKNDLPLTTIASQLQNLSNTCVNHIISDLITKQIERCNSKQYDSKAEFRCIMFYDINTQLCTAFSRSKYNLQENYTAKMNEVQNLKTICHNAGTWQFNFKDKYPQNESVDQVFNDEALCIQMCANDDFVSADANYFCKYYQWGTAIIKSQAEYMKSHSDVNAEHMLDAIPNLVNNTTTVNAPKIDNSKTSTHESVANAKPETVIEQVKSEASEVELSSQKQPKETLSIQAVVPNDNKQSEQSIPVPDLSTKNEIEKPPKIDTEEGTPQKETQAKEVQTNDAPPVDTQLKDNLSDKDMPFDDDDADDKEKNADYDSDDTDPKQMEADPGTDLKPYNDKDHKNVPLVDSEHDVKAHKDRVAIESIGGKFSSGDKFPNPMQDTFVEGEDHFFPFFMTAIISVVILYILYHNKNKLMKLLLGLLVEGRQPGRRRNSRGHAYRRLDTLEQAMSTNSTAPPSKIIY